MSIADWQVIVLAAGRGPDDPMARAFGVPHKCTIPIAGQPMLRWVVVALAAAGLSAPYRVIIDNADAARAGAADLARHVLPLPSQSSAPASARFGVEDCGRYPVLITTGDHPLLTAAMITDFLQQAEHASADFVAGLATAETILAGYPDTKRTFFRLGADRVSGCNLFAVMSPKGLAILDLWSHVEKNRKKPWKVVAAFGLKPLLLFALGRLTLARAAALMSARLGMTLKVALLPFAEAAIDVDKPSDHALAEAILTRRA